MRRLTTHALIVAMAAIAVVGVAPSASAAHRDRRAPVVAIATPDAGDTASGLYTVAGSASDNVKVSRVAVALDGGAFTPATGTTAWSTAIDTGSAVDGPHTFKVKAWDGRGNVAIDTVDVTFANGEPAVPAGPTSTTTPEGTKIEVDSAGPWTATQIADMLQRNGLDSTVGPRLTVKVQDSLSSQVSTSTSRSGETYTSFTAVMYLKGVNSTFAATPEATLAHEYGHARSLYHLYLSQQGDWSRYLQARGLDGDPRLDSSYEWGKNEIIADDYRLLFGTSDAIAQRPQHLNTSIPDPRNVPGLRTFLAQVWEEPLP